MFLKILSNRKLIISIIIVVSSALAALIPVKRFIKKRSQFKKYRYEGM